MGFREFVVHRRVLPAVVAPALLGGAVAVVVAWSPAGPSAPVDTALRASVTECHDMVTISVAGRGDTPAEGTTKLLVDANGNVLPAALSDDYASRWVDPVVNAPRDDVGPGSYAAVYIAYPADMNTYEEAVQTGVANSEQVIREISAACPDTRFAIVGYSEGADVVRRVAMNIGHQETDGSGYGIVDPANVTGVVILADAGRSAGDGPFPGARNPYSNPDGFDVRYQDGQAATPGQGALPDTSGDFGALAGKVASFCSDGDLTCSAPQNVSLLQLAANVGRQIDIDTLERDKLTPATGQDIAETLADVAFKAFNDIAAQPNWMQSDETFLDVLLKVSDPSYVPGAPAAEPAQAVTPERISGLAYLPQKVFNEIVGLIVTNQNTIPVLLSDPYAVTIGQDYSGHHFDYWRDADPANGRQLTSSEYAAAWLTHLAKQAQAGEPVDTAAKPTEVELAAALDTVAAATSTAAVESRETARQTARSLQTTEPQLTTRAAASTTTETSSATPSTTETSVPAAVPSTTTVAPAETTAPTETTRAAETTLPTESTSSAETTQAPVITTTVVPGE